MAYPSGLKMDIDLGHIGPLVEDGECEFLISLIEFVSINKFRERVRALRFPRDTIW